MDTGRNLPVITGQGATSLKALEIKAADANLHHSIEILLDRKILPRLEDSAVKWSRLHGFRPGLHPRDIAGILRHDVAASLRHYSKLADPRPPALEKLE